MATPRKLKLPKKQDATIDLEIQDLFNKAKKSLPPEVFAAIAVIALQLSKNGLPLADACLIANVDYKNFLAYMEQNPLVARIVETKELQYKRDLLKTISEKARGGDDKMAQWLLSVRYPNEFAPKKSNGDPDPGESSLLMQAIEFVQKSGDSTPLITERSARAVVVRRDADSDRHLIESVKDILK